MLLLLKAAAIFIYSIEFYIPLSSRTDLDDEYLAYIAGLIKTLQLNDDDDNKLKNCIKSVYQDIRVSG